MPAHANLNRPISTIIRTIVVITLASVIAAVGTITTIGVYLADAVQKALAHIQDVEQILVVVVLAAALIGYAVYRLRGRRTPPPSRG